MTEENADCSWEFNAPQYVDFRSQYDDENVEAYFGEELKKMALKNW